MTNAQLNDIYTCSAGTFATITGLDTNSLVAEFTLWMFNNVESINWQGCPRMTIAHAYALYSNQDPTKRRKNTDKPTSGGMTVEESKAYLASRGNDTLMGIGFDRIQAMQQGKYAHKLNTK